MAAPYAFDADTRVEPVAEGVFAAHVSDRWNAAADTPNGGYLLALCLRALQSALPHPDPVVASAHFLRPGRPGPAELHVEVARSGRRFSTGEVRLLQGGREAVRCVGTFGDLAAAESPGGERSSPPALPPFQDLPDVVGPGTMPGVTITERIRYRSPSPPGWLRGEPTGEPAMELYMSFSDGRPPDALSLALLVDAAPPAVLEAGAGGSSTLELTVHVRARPRPGPLACRVATAHPGGGLHEEDFEIWDSAGRLVAQSRQLALLL